MDCLSTRRKPMNVGKIAINTSLFSPQEEVISSLLHRLAELEQRVMLQRYEMHVLEAEMEVLRCDSLIG
jgi:hypothetical protein